MMTGPRSITSKTYEDLRNAILECELLPGRQLNINEICKRYGVSLSAVREALSRLTSDGLVVAQPQKGFSVAPISLPDLEDLTQTRIAIEQFCFRLAVQNGDVEWEAAIVSAFHRLERAPIEGTGEAARPSADWLKAHVQFHEALISACPSRRLRELRRFYALQAERYIRIAIPLGPSFQNNDIRADHQKLVNAAFERRADDGCVLLEAHMSRTMQALSSVLGTTISSKERKAVPGPELSLVTS
jgi:DNA-binding GntR family transcriptional regulator